MHGQTEIKYHYKFWNDRVTETRLSTQKGYLTILAVYGPTEGRDELNEEFCETLQNILDKVNKNYYIMLIGDMNNRVDNVVGTNGEAALNSNGRKLIDFCIIQQLINNEHREILNLLGKQEDTNQLLITS